jgi:hypothetical protein
MSYNHFRHCTDDLYPTPTCGHKCQNNTTAYTANKHYGVSAYAVCNAFEAIQREIFVNGPVETTFKVDSIGYLGFTTSPRTVNPIALVLDTIFVRKLSRLQVRQQARD